MDIPYMNWIRIKGMGADKVDIRNYRFRIDEDGRKRDFFIDEQPVSRMDYRPTFIEYVCYTEGENAVGLVRRMAKANPTMHIEIAVWHGGHNDEKMGILLMEFADGRMLDATRQFEYPGMGQDFYIESIKEDTNEKGS